MSSTYIPAELRKQVYQRASGQCEYCLMPAQLSLISLAIANIVAEKQGGQTRANNLALSCPICNQYKGSDIASIDPHTGKLSAFYNPRIDGWKKHFSLSKAILVPLSGKGRVTAKILQLNRADRVNERRLLAEANLLRVPD